MRRKGLYDRYWAQFIHVCLPFIEKCNSLYGFSNWKGEMICVFYVKFEDEWDKNSTHIYVLNVLVFRRFSLRWFTVKIHTTTDNGWVLKEKFLIKEKGKRGKGWLFLIFNHLLFLLRITLCPNLMNLSRVSNLSRTVFNLENFNTIN